MQKTSIPDRERRLLEQVVARAHALKEERERLARRLADLEKELALLAAKLDGLPTELTLARPEPRRS